MPVALIAPLLLAHASVFGGNASQLPLEIIEKKQDEARKRALESQAVTAPALPQRTACAAAVESDPDGAARYARDAMGRAVGEERVRAGLCLGLALTALEQWDQAQQAFLDARAAATDKDFATRARLGDMAANAALARGEREIALSLLTTAAGEAAQSGDATLIASVAVDKARAQVARNQPLLAAQALRDALAADPANAQAWLLSATLSRRLNNLAEAQTQIAKAAELAPRDPEVGLEAGVIAMLSGKEDAARRSWDSVVTLAPDSDAAVTARGYIAQLTPKAPSP